MRDARPGHSPAVRGVRGTAHARPSLWPPSFAGGIFDFDGTLAETASLWREVDEEFLRRRGLPWDESIHLELAKLGFSGGSRWIVARFGLDERPDDICDEWNEMGARLYRERVRLRPGAARYLRALRGRGVPCALATTNDTRVLHAMRNVDVDGLFDAVVCGAEVARGKDEPDIYLEAARRLGVAPADCVVFEDIEAGIASARRAGMATCAVRSGDPTQDFERLATLADVAIGGWKGLAPG